MGKIKIIIVDDEKLIREGLSIIMSTYQDIEVMGTCSNGKEAYEYCKNKKVDLVLMDIRMPVCDGVLGTKLIKEAFKAVKILILTTFKDSEYIEDALKYGASGYLLKDSSYDLIYAGIKAIIKGNIVVHPDIINKMMIKENNDNDINKVKQETSLTDKEIKIIEEIANGLSNKEISEKIYLTEGTIKNNITTILSKLSLRDRTQIVIYAFKNNIVT
ncbi:response regulator transcription factor [Clostridium gasigenes]|uniref:response regulator n=1 Tax=Clostridium gasigenes TaxID=94869 RepID=UPI00162A351F|nr:response regulator transcription factor [Clostridium gasigenes]MBU3089893.1 response regulator transcription factor [Clostridium gasigenes]MBU3133395.1 response regulator transcription factor [Clostridium gasigenes]